MVVLDFAQIPLAVETMLLLVSSLVFDEPPANFLYFAVSSMEFVANLSFPPI